MKFDYDAFGQRIAKHIYTIGTTPIWEESTYYVRDAQGNIMGTYRLKYENGGLGFTPFLSYKITERPIYGSNRVGLNGFHRDLLPFAPMTPGQDPYAPSTYPPIRKKMYELSNHLGNVLSVVSDAKFPTVATVGTPIQSYNADVVSYSDFMPFGSTMTGRTFSSEKYRYGFNGKENDNEVKGQGAQQDYGMRIYDPRLGRFLSVDPIAKQYPELTPYQFASNTPIQAIDLDGLEAGYLFKASGYSPKTDSKKLIEDGGNIVKDFALKVGELYVNALLMMTGEGAGAAVGEKAILGAVERKVIAAEVGAAKLEIQTAGEVKQVLNSDASEVVITKVGKTRTGETRVKALQGEKELDITKERVKEYKPEPKAKTGKRQVDFKKEGYPDGSNPHPKGDTKKRTPTTDEKKMVDDNTPKK